MTTDVREIVARLKGHSEIMERDKGKFVRFIDVATCTEAADLITALAAKCDAGEACADRLLQMIEVSVRRYTDELERTECILPLKAEIRRLQEQVTELMDELGYHGIYPSDLMGEPEQ
jgi:hypothetical protein